MAVPKRNINTSTPNMAVPKKRTAKEKLNPDRLKVYTIMYYIKGGKIYFLMNRYRSTTPGGDGNGELNFQGGSLKSLNQKVLERDATNGKFLKTPEEILQILWEEAQREAEEET